MNNSFRYAEHPTDQVVSLRLFTGANGDPQGAVSGPKRGYSYAISDNVVELVQSATLDDAFAAGIRMANKNDTDLVISGDSELWRSKWGTLDR